jgi:hypothetical protein
MLASTVFGQSSAELDNYHYFSNIEGYTWSPVFQVTSEKKLYTSVRYNYDESITLSAIAGRSFSSGSQFKTLITPAAGFATGQYNGFILALNTNITYGRIQLSSQGQYSFGIGKTNFNSFYSWSDLACKLSKNISAGFALQQRNDYGLTGATDPGIFAELQFGDWSFPFYYFNSDSGQNTIVGGINLEWQLKKSK